MGTLEKVIEADGSCRIEGSGSQVPFQRLPVDIVLGILLQLPFLVPWTTQVRRKRIQLTSEGSPLC